MDSKQAYAYAIGTVLACANASHHTSLEEGAQSPDVGEAAGELHDINRELEEREEIERTWEIVKSLEAEAIQRGTEIELDDPKRLSAEQKVALARLSTTASELAANGVAERRPELNEKISETTAKADIQVQRDQEARILFAREASPEQMDRSRKNALDQNRKLQTRIKF